MSLQYSRSYDNVDGHTHYTIALNSMGTGVSFPGTQTANTVIKELFSCPAGVAGRLLGVKMKLTTGGTVRSMKC